MNCPECNKKKIVIMHTDPIECTDCGSTMKIDYCLCPSCDYTFRTNNGKYIDGDFVDYEVMEEAFEELLESMDAETDIRMMDLIDNCVRCGQPSVHKDNEGCYNCALCGFKWEILGNG